jgi:hypothetical protein
MIKIIQISNPHIVPNGQLAHGRDGTGPHLPIDKNQSKKSGAGRGKNGKENSQTAETKSTKAKRQVSKPQTTSILAVITSDVSES